MDTKEGKVTASVEELAHYNMRLTEAIYELLADTRESSQRKRCWNVCVSSKPRRL